MIMDNKINIAELLKDCPSGMELDCALFESLEFDSIVDNDFLPIRCRIENSSGGYNVYNFTKYGCWSDMPFAKCIIFPKGKTTWEGFQRPFKDGDVVVAEDAESFHLFLLKHLTYSENDNSYDGYCYFGWDFQCNELFEKGNWAFNRLATEEEKAKLFKVIKANGYKWNEETKTLEKLVEPIFKVGDKIKDKNNKIWFVVQVSDKHFSISLIPNAEGYFVPIEDQDEYELVPNKFDIATLKPFESRVLVRGDIYNFWKPAIFGFIKDKIFYLLGGAAYEQCIPYKNNEHLLGTTNDCDEYYKTW